MQQGSVARQRQRVGGQFAFEADAFFAGGEVALLQNLAAKSVPVDGFALFQALPGVEAGKREQLVDEVFGAADAFADLVQMVGLFVGFAHFQHFGLHFECGQRAAQFVCCVGGETFFALGGRLNALEKAVERVDHGLGFAGHGAADGGEVVGAAGGEVVGEQVQRADAAFDGDVQQEREHGQHEQRGGKLHPYDVPQHFEAFVPALRHGGGEAVVGIVVINDAEAVVVPHGRGVGEAVDFAVWNLSAFLVGQKQLAFFVPDGDAVVFVFGETFALVAEAFFHARQAHEFVGFDIGQGAGEFAHLAVGRFVEFVEGEGEGDGVGNQPDQHQAATDVVEQAGADGGFGREGFEQGHGLGSAG